MKESKGKNIFIVILVLLVLGLSGYIVYDKFIKNESDNKPEENVNEREEKTEYKSLNITSNEVTSLYKRFDVLNDREGIGGNFYSGYLYRTDSLNDSEIPDDVKVLVGLDNALKECGTCETDADYGGSFLSIPKANLDKQVKKIFGNVEYKTVNTKAVDCSNQGYTYNQEKDTYETTIYGCGGSFSKFRDEIIKAEKNDKELNIYVRVAFFEPITGNDSTDACASWYVMDCVTNVEVYSDYAKKNKIFDTKEDYTQASFLEKNKEKLPQYKLNFKISGNEYYFNSVTKVK